MKPVEEKIRQEIAEMTPEQKWKAWEGLKARKSLTKMYEDALKETFITDMGDNESLELHNGAGVYWQTKNYKDIQAEKAQAIVDDLDLFTQIVKVDMKKAKEILPEEVFKELKNNQEVIRTTRSLMTGKVV